MPAPQQIIIMYHFVSMIEKTTLIIGLDSGLNLAHHNLQRYLNKFMAYRLELLQAFKLVSNGLKSNSNKVLRSAPRKVSMQQLSIVLQYGESVKLNKTNSSKKEKQVFLCLLGPRWPQQWHHLLKDCGFSADEKSLDLPRNLWHCSSGRVHQNQP